MRADLLRRQPASVVVCLLCSHNSVDREGTCKAEIRLGPFSNKFRFCGCKCEFPVAATTNTFAVTELLRAALEHPELAEGHIRQAMEMLSAATTAAESEGAMPMLTFICDVCHVQQHAAGLCANRGRQRLRCQFDRRHSDRCGFADGHAGERYLAVAGEGQPQTISYAEHMEQQLSIVDALLAPIDDDAPATAAGAQDGIDEHAARVADIVQAMTRCSPAAMEDLKLALAEFAEEIKRQAIEP